ncbi:MAG: YHYH protein [Actinomycetota bacterium]
MPRLLARVPLAILLFAACAASACASSDGAVDAADEPADSTDASSPDHQDALADEPVTGDEPLTQDGAADQAAGVETGCLTAVGNATVACGSEQIVIESNGLPEHELMVGISEGGWNGQWPTTQDYTGSNAFSVPTDVTLLDEPLATVMNTAGVTANGIPFFFPHAPGSGDCVVDLEDAGGECLRDPVADGEMDVCGGHTGRGDDYHYHATPTCLIEELPEGAVIGYLLDGIPMYAEPIEGSVPYDGCTSGWVSPDGLLHHAFQDSYPYLTDCMLGAFTEGPSTTGAEVYTGDLDVRANGEIVGFVEDEDGCHTMTFESGAELFHCH